MPVGLPGDVHHPGGGPSPGWVQHLVNVGTTIWTDHPVSAAAATVWIQVGIGVFLLVAPRGLLVAGRRRGECRLGPRGLGVRRGLRRRLRPRQQLALRIARGGPLLCRGRRARSPSATRAGRRPSSAGGCSGGWVPSSSGMGVLQAWPGRGFWSGQAHSGVDTGDADRHGRPDGPGLPAVGVRLVGPVLRIVRCRPRLGGQPRGRGGPARDRRLLRERPTPPPPGRRHRRGRPLPGHLGPRPGLRLLRRRGHRPQLDDPDGRSSSPPATWPWSGCRSGPSPQLPSRPTAAAAGCPTGGFFDRLSPSYLLRSLAAIGAVGVVLVGAAPDGPGRHQPQLPTPSSPRPPTGRPTSSMPRHRRSPSPTRPAARSPPVLAGHTVVLTFLDPVCTSDCPLIAQELRVTDQMLGARPPASTWWRWWPTPSTLSTAVMIAFDKQEGLDHVPNWTFLTGSGRPAREGLERLRRPGGRSPRPGR